MKGIFSPQPSPENLRHQLEDPPSLNLSHNEEIARDNPTEPSSSFENITISEENQETASEETESPGLDFLSFKLSQSGLWVRRTTVTIPSLIGENRAGAISENVTTPEEEEARLQEEIREAETMIILQNIMQDLRQTQSIATRVAQSMEDCKLPFSQFNPI